MRVRVPKLPFRSPASTPSMVEPLPAKKHTGVDYETEWRVVRRADDSPRAARGVIGPTMQVLASPDRRGLDYLQDLARADPPQPVIFAANHHSHVDTPLLLSSIPEPGAQMFVGAAADYFFKTRVTSTVSALALNAIPIERTRVSRRSADDAAELIDNGWSMLIFPEGGRSPDGWASRSAVARPISRCAATFRDSVHLEGTGRILRKGSKRLSRQPPASRSVHAMAGSRRGEDSRACRTHRARRRRARRRDRLRLVHRSFEHASRCHARAVRSRGALAVAASMGARRSRTSFDWSPSGDETPVARPVLGRNGEADPGAAGNTVLDPESSAVRLHHALQIASRSRTRAVGRLRQAGEHREDRVSVLVRDADPLSVTQTNHSPRRRSDMMSMIRSTPGRRNFNELLNRFSSSCRRSVESPNTHGSAPDAHRAGVAHRALPIDHQLSDDDFEIDPLAIVFLPADA